MDEHRSELKDYLNLAVKDRIVSEGCYSDLEGKSLRNARAMHRVLEAYNIPHQLVGGVVDADFSGDDEITSMAEVEENKRHYWVEVKKPDQSGVWVLELYSQAPP